MNKRWLVYAVFLLILSWFLFYGINQYPYPYDGEFSDFTISHYPNLIYTQNSLKSWHQIPLWNTSILSGNPFGADPLSSLWYPPYWLAIALPAPLGLNLLTLVHMIAGGFGLAQLIKAMGYGDIPAFAGGVVFLLMPKIYAHLGAGHITMIWAVCLTPWLLFFECRSSRSSGILTSKFLPALIAGLILLADVRWGVWSWLLWWSFAFKYSSRVEIGETGKVHKLLVKEGWLKVKQSFTAILIASPLLLPLIQFTTLSTRNSITPADTLILSLPPLSLFGLIYPNFGGSAEWTVYFGLVPLFLLLVVAAQKEDRSKATFWIIWFLLSVIVSLGDALPGAEYVAQIPLISFLRVPPRALFVAGISLAVITAAGVQTILKMEQYEKKKRFRLEISGFTLLIVGLAIILGIQAEKPAGFIWGAVFSGLIGSIMLLRSYQLASGKATTVILFALLIADLGYVSRSMLRFEKEPVGISDTLEVIHALNETNGEIGRVYSPSYSIPQEAGAVNKIRQADGINPLALDAYAVFMENASGVENVGYSVTLPAFKTGNPAIDNQNAIPDAGMLGLLNVTHVVSAFPSRSDGLAYVKQVNGTYLYQNSKAMPSAWVQQDDQLIEGADYWHAQILLYSPNKVTIKADGAGILVLADPMYPGWVARLDGEKATIISLSGLLRGVQLPAGRHTVEFIFHPVLLYFGFFLQFLVFFSFVAWLILQKKQAK